MAFEFSFHYSYIPMVAGRSAFLDAPALVLVINCECAVEKCCQEPSPSICLNLKLL